MHSLATTPAPTPADGAPDSGGTLDRDGDSRLGQLFDEHGRSLLRAALRVVGNESDAEDAVQTVFLRLIRREEVIDFDHPGVVGYLHRSCVNAGLDQLRQRKRSAIDDSNDGSSIAGLEASPARRLEGREVAAALRRALVELSPRAAEIFSMRYFQEMTNQHIAELLDTSPGVVAVTLHRSRHQLKGLLAPLLGEAS